MAKTKLNLCTVSQFCFLLCFVVLIVAGTDTNTGSSDSDQSPNPDPVDDSELLLAFQRLAQIVGKRNSEQGKVIEEMKQQIQSLQSAQETCHENVKSLNTKLDELTNKISEDSGVWLLTPPLRGPPGKQGDKGDKGETGPKGESIPTGQKGESEPKGGRISAPPSIKSCSVAMEILPTPRSKKQFIYPHGNGNSTSLEVLCDFETDGGGWTLIQKRTSGPKEEFNQNWNEYTKGFGSIQGNFWLGLENIHTLTQNGDQELRIELEDFEGEKKWAKYSSFSISDASDFYRLSISGFYRNSTAGDSMTNSAHSSSNILNGMRFSTKDKDNDNYSSGSSNCAEYYGSGWWLNECGFSNLNGRYFEKGETVPTQRSIFWVSWKGWNNSFAKSEMKIRPRKS